MLRQVLLGTVIWATLWPASSSAQLASGTEDCLAIPGVAPDNRQSGEKQPPKENQPKQVKIQALSFTGQTGLTPEERLQVVKLLTERTYRADSNWTEELKERIRDAWQQRGYFRTVIGQLTADKLQNTSSEETLAITVEVHAGQAYRLDAIEFRNATQFVTAELRSLFPIQQGDVFDIHKIQQGIENLRKAYGRRGFINFSAVPATELDETRGLIKLFVELDEGKQFHIGKIEVLGLDAALAAKLLRESGLETGSLFDAFLLDKFFEQNRQILPTGAKPEEDARRVLDEDHGLVDITMDFRGCPQAANAHDPDIGDGQR